MFEVIAGATVTARNTFSITAKDASGQALGINVLVLGTGQPANTTNFYTFGPSMPQQTATTAGTASAPFPEIVLGPSSTLAFTINTNGQAGDTIDIGVSVEAYPD